MEKQMTKEERKQLVEKVKKLYAVASDAGASVGEVENAMRMARRLLTKYNLSFSEFDVKDKEFVRQAIFEGKTNRPSWQRDMVMVVCDYYLTTIIGVSGHAGRRYEIIGTPENAELTAFAVNYILREYISLVEAYMKQYKKENKPSAFGRDIGYMVKLRNSFYHGLNRGLKSVLKKEEAEEQQRGIVLARDKDLDKFVDELTNGRHTKTQNGSEIIGDAYQSGVTQGSKIQIRTGINNQSVSNGNLLAGGVE